MCTCYQIDQFISNRVACHDHKCTPDTSIENRKPDSSFDPVYLSRSQILPTIGCHCISKHAKHKHKHFCQLSCRCLRHDIISSKFIDRCLQSQRTNIDQRTHKTHRQTGTQHIFHHCRTRVFKIFPTKPQKFISLYHINPANNKCNRLCKYRCDCRTFYTTF